VNPISTNYIICLDRIQLLLNLKTQYSIIGGSTGAFFILLIVISLSQPGSPADLIPIIPVGDQIISNETQSVPDESTDDSPAATVVVISENPVEPEEKPTIETPIEVVTDNTQSVVYGRSGGGGGGSSNNNNNDNDDFTYTLKLFENGETVESDGNAIFGQQMTAIAETDDNSVVKVKFVWLDPAESSTANEVQIESDKADDSTQLNVAGPWVVEADFGNGEVIRKEFNVTVLVIPESPVGMIALMAASLGTLGAFFYVRRNSLGNSRLH
jgi:hypothetical protein